MIEKIKLFLYKYLRNSKLSDEIRDKRFVNYAKAQTILILFESNYNEKNPEIRLIQKALVDDNKKVTLLAYVDKKSSDSAILPNYRILHQNDFTWFGKPKSEIINYINELKYDIVIDLTLNEVIPLLYILSYVNASFKTGVRKKLENHYDFTLDIDSYLNSQAEDGESNEIDATFIYNNLIFYLKNIKTND